VQSIRVADSGEATAFRAAELARDTLAAPGLASALFVQFAARYPTSLFAPKALIAAGQLHRVPADSVQHALRTRYAASPYTLAYEGAPSPAYEAVEESLAIALGGARLQEFPVAAVGRFAPPRTGPRGPALEPAVLALRKRQVAPAPGGPRETRPDRPRRPGDKPQDRPEHPKDHP
jgi:hypothetical protein